MKAETKIFSKEVAITDFLEHCVDVPRFLSCCSACPNFGKTWSCPPYDFDPVDYWKQFQTFYLYAVKTTTPANLLEQTYSLEDLMRIGGEITKSSNEEMCAHLQNLQEQFPESKIIGGGTCLLCGAGNCARQKGEPCRFPEQMSYSIESLGGNVEETLKRYFGEQIYWGKEGKLAPHYIRVGGLLKK